MGKKSLTKSTTKKKAAKKKAAPKKSGAPKKMAAKKKPTKKKPTLKSLLKKDFGTWTPDKITSVPPDESYLNGFSAPPVIDEKNKEKAKKIRALIAKQFHLEKTKDVDKPAKKSTPKKDKPKKESAKPKKTTKKAKKEPKKKEPAKKAVSISELLKLKFDSWHPDKLVTVEPDENYHKGFTAPPAIDESNKEEADRIKALLFKTIDLTISDIKQEAVTKKPDTTVQEETSGADEKVEKIVREDIEAPETTKTDDKPEVPAAETVDAEPVSKEPEIETAKTQDTIEEPVVEPEKMTAEPQPEKPPAAEKEPEKSEPASKDETKPEKEEKIQPDKPVITPLMPPTPEETVPPVPPVPFKAEEESEPMNPALKMLIICMAGLFGLLILSSIMNTNNYYLKQTKYGVEVWKGKFSPSGQKMIASMPGAKVPEPSKKEYSEAEVKKTAFSYFTLQAEKLSKAKGLPDFESIKSNLNNALLFAPSNKHQKDIKLRINKIDLIVLEYKADEAAGKKTIKGYQSALKLLNKASGLNVVKSDKVRLDKKINSLNNAIARLTKKTAPKATVKKAPAKQKTVKKDDAAQKKAAPKPAAHH